MYSSLSLRRLCLSQLHLIVWDSLHRELLRKFDNTRANMEKVMASLRLHPEAMQDIHRPMHRLPQDPLPGKYYEA